MTENTFPFWTLVRRMGSSHEVMKVTSEKGQQSWRNQYYGSVDGVPSHCRTSDTRGRFESAEAALAQVEGVRAIRARWKPEHDRISALYSKAHADEEDEIKNFLTRENAT